MKDPTEPWNVVERAVLDGLRSPFDVQAFLDRLPYSTEPIYRSPRRVLRDRVAHCFDGALFAAAALRRQGHRPRILDMLAERDDDHVLALFQVDGLWGAVAKSNFAGLRYREPIHRTLRELALSYFELFYNVEREKTLRGYTVALDLATLDRLDWMTHDESIDAVADRLDRCRRIPLITPEQVRRLSPVDQRSYEAGLLGSDAAGLYRPT